MVFRAVRLPETEMIGIGAVTVPLTEIFFGVAPVLLSVMLPVKLPEDALAGIRT